MDYEKMWNELYKELAESGGVYIKASNIVQYMLKLEKEENK